MNNELFQQAHSSYLSKQYEDALVQFTECLQDKDYEFAPGELGLLYHQIGNCLVKLHDPNEAIHAYSQAVLDEEYDSLAAVRYNLGTVYATQNDYENAATYFKQAADDPEYPTPYKAFTGLG
ncbi:MAG: tetratricopeptide repeat protein, partial [Anaerotardibacter sp.]